MADAPTKSCDECGSLFYAKASSMDALCPECAHTLYGYQACAHIFKDGRCLKCFWDGSVSAHIQKIKAGGPAA
jgi:predicted RNA-binding Zn-ribbon protein involved in translation (DUF1610 family)